MSARTYSPAVQACLEVAAVLVAPNPGICDTVWASEFTTAYEVLFHAVVEETGLSDEEVEAESATWIHSPKPAPRNPTEASDERAQER
jgi:hypothetical protein